jgi:hypothetical protein
VFGGGLESEGGRFRVGAFGRNLASSAVKVSHVIHFIKTCYACYTFNVICKVNAAINSITVHHKTG